MVHRPLAPGETLDTSVTDLGGADVSGRHPGRGALRAGRRRWPGRRRTVVDDGAARSARVPGSGDDARRPPVSRSRARANPLGSVTAHLDERRWPTATPRCPAIGRRTTSTSRWRARPVSTSCSRHGLCTMAICTHRLLGLLGVDDPGRVSAGGRPVRVAYPVGLRPDGERLWHQRTNSFAFEAAANGTTTITHGRLELRS